MKNILPQQPLAQPVKRVAMPIEHQREKLLNMIAYFSKHTKKCGRTKLLKLLYHADFRHFKETGRPITGLRYYAWKWGPVPTELWRELKDERYRGEDLRKSFGILIDERNDRFELKLRKPFKFIPVIFTPRELKIIEDVATIFRDADGDTMVDSTHLPDDPWQRTLSQWGLGREIPYDFSFDSSEESLPKEEHLERLRDDRAIRETFE